MADAVNPRVLIIGSGPAGLAAARALAGKGIDGILIIDRDDAPGGLPRFCHHPGFGMEYARWPYSGPGFVNRLLRDLKDADVRIECRTTLLSLRDGPEAQVVGPTLGLRWIRPQALIIATGIRESNRGNLAVPGGRAEAGILTTGQLQQMVARGVALPAHVKSAVIVGSEHISFSALWTARKAGLRVKAIVGTEDRIMSFAPLGVLANACGVEIMINSRVREIETAAGAVTAAIVETPNGTRRLPTESLIFTANWIPETAALIGGPITLDPRTGGPQIDQAMRTSSRGVFAAGNVLHGVESSGWCANEGRHAGELVARYLRGEISGERHGAMLELSEEIDFAVPQFWDCGLAHHASSKAFPVNVRMKRDVAGRRLTLKTGETVIWSGPRTRLLRKRRIVFLPSVAAVLPTGPMKLDLAD
jgi:thioredoxin reductase